MRIGFWVDGSGAVAAAAKPKAVARNRDIEHLLHRAGLLSQQPIDAGIEEKLHDRLISFAVQAQMSLRRLDVADLSDHVCIAFILPSTGRVLPWMLRDAGQAIDWTPPSRLKVSEDPVGVVGMALANAGICQTYAFIAAAHLQRGDLVEVLADTRGRTRPFSVLYSPHRQLQPAARALIDALITDAG